MNAFAALEKRIAGAPAEAEFRLFAEALTLMAADSALGRPFEAGCFADTAIGIHRALLPGTGFQLGATASGRGLASTWAKGDAQRLPFEAPTPGLALLRATAHAVALAHEHERRVSCVTCRGRGWIITRTGERRDCRHVPYALFADPLNRGPRDPVAQQDRAADS